MNSKQAANATQQTQIYSEQMSNSVSRTLTQVWKKSESVNKVSTDAQMKMLLNWQIFEVKLSWSRIFQTQSSQISCAAAEDRELNNHIDLYKLHWTCSFSEQNSHIRLSVTDLLMWSGQKDSRTCHCTLQQICEMLCSFVKLVNWATRYQRTDWQFERSSMTS